jgi:hypothetical protein
MNVDKSRSYPKDMGPRLRAEVEGQLLKDFERYAPQQCDQFAIDWFDTCPEGHATTYLDGWLQNYSNVRVVNQHETTIAEGWIDFIHGGGENPLFVFWYYLSLRENTENVVQTQGIPQHIWDSLPESSKDLCLKSEMYDAAWGNDPLVLQWKRQRRQQ